MMGDAAAESAGGATRAGAGTTQGDDVTFPQNAAAAPAAPSTVNNGNTTQPMGPMQPNLHHLPMVPQSAQQIVSYPAQQMVTHPIQQMVQYPAQQMLPYQAQQMLPYQAQQIVPYQAQQGSPYQAPHYHPYAYHQNAASTSSGSNYSPQPSTSRARAPQQRPTRRVGRPRKYPAPERDEDEPAPQVLVVSNPTGVCVPARDEHDVCVGENKNAKCSACKLWAGRYVLEPCYHYGFCVSCLEVNANIDKAHNKSPACPACDTTISAYFSGIRVSILNVNYDDE